MYEQKWQFEAIAFWLVVCVLTILVGEAKAKELQSIPEDPQERAVVSDALKRPSTIKVKPDPLDKVRYAIPYQRLSNEESAQAERNQGSR